MPMRLLLVSLVTLLLAVPGLTPPVLGQGTPGGETSRGARDVILATTTSTQDSGLLDVLVPRFDAETGYRLKPIAVGSGAALELGRRGEADVLLSHSPAAEEEFMAEGFGRSRATVMANDFVLVGPEADPAGIARMTDTTAAMRAIAAAAPFVSRGDDSGTHALEQTLWRQAGIAPAGSWYTEAGVGMGETLNIASERAAYTLTDRATFYALQERLSLRILLEGAPELLNIYHVITVNPANGPAVNTAGAGAFAVFLTDPATQRLIGQFGVDRFGAPLFVPCADSPCQGTAKSGPATPTATRAA